DAFPRDRPARAPAARGHAVSAVREWHAHGARRRPYRSRRRVLSGAGVLPRTPRARRVGHDARADLRRGHARRRACTRGGRALRARAVPGPQHGSDDATACVHRAIVRTLRVGRRSAATVGRGGPRGPWHSRHSPDPRRPRPHPAPSARAGASCRDLGAYPSALPLQRAGAPRRGPERGADPFTGHRRSGHPVDDGLSPGVVSMNPQLATRLRSLRLSGMVDAFPGRLAQAQAAPLGHAEFLELLVEDELTRRADRLFTRRLKQAAITQVKSLSDIDWTFNPKLPKARLVDLVTAQFVRTHAGVLLIGPPG